LLLIVALILDGEASLLIRLNAELNGDDERAGTVDVDAESDSGTRNLYGTTDSSVAVAVADKLALGDGDALEKNLLVTPLLLLLSVLFTLELGLSSVLPDSMPNILNIPLDGEDVRLTCGLVGDASGMGTRNLYGTNSSPSLMINQLRMFMKICNKE